MYSPLLSILDPLPLSLASNSRAFESFTYNPTASPDLPQELLDEVVDHLWDDVPALLACSLSCHTLSAATRVHLFHAIRLVGSAQYHRFERLLVSSPTLIRHIRKLTLVGCLVSYPDAWITQVPQLLAKLPRVEEMELSMLHWAVFQLGIQSHTSLAALKRLVLTNVTFSTAAQISTLLADVPNITALRLHNVHCLRSSPLEPPPSTTPHSLHDLVLDGGNCHEALVDSLVASGRASELRSLFVRWNDQWMDNRETKYLERLLPACKHSLEDLRLELPHFMVADDIWEMDLNLEHNIRLRSLRVDGLMLPQSCTWGATVLSRIASPCLKTFDMSTRLAQLSDIYSAEWRHIDSVFKHDVFIGVSVTFHVSCLPDCGSVSNVEKIMGCFLPQLLETGKLSVSSH